VKQPSKVVKALNFAHLSNQQQEHYHKKQYNHAEYFSPEQIERADDTTLMQSGELWNLGVILFALYQGEFPFPGSSDDKIVSSIISRPNNWTPNWRDGISESLKSFVMMCMESDSYLRLDKIQYMNHTYIMQHHTPQEVVAHNRVLVSNLQRIYEIHAREQFVEAILPYYAFQVALKK
jgi:serine/threonine protein kinase